MLKSLLLSSVRPFLAPPDDKATAAAKERETIVVTKPEGDDDGNNEDNNDKDNKGEEKKEGEEGSDENSDDDKSGDEEGDGEGEEEGQDDKEEGDENSEEEKKELTAEQKEIERLKKQLDRAQRRIGKTSAERDTNKKKVAELQAALDKKIEEGEQPLTEEEVERRAELKAEKKVTETQFDNMQKSLISDAKKLDPKFMEKIGELAADVAPLPGFMIPALANLDHENGGAVLNYLTDNPDEYETILASDDATKMLTKLIRISDKLHEASKPKPKKISKTPDPAKPLKGNQSSPSVLPSDPTKDMDKFVRVRAQQAEAHRKKKLGLV